MDYGQHLVTTLVCFVKVEGGFCPGALVIGGFCLGGFCQGELSSGGGELMSYTHVPHTHTHKAYLLLRGRRG